MMKKLILFPLFASILIVSGCNSSVDFGDTNVDDDAVTSANTEGLMAGAMNRFFTLSGRNYFSKPTLYVQYQAQNVYTDEQRYNESPASWNGYYLQTLSNLKEVVDINSAEEVDDLTLTYGAPENQIGVAELMSALIWKRITDTYGPVPYTEALGESVSPAYDNQETIYKDLVSRIKAARDMLDASKAGPTGDAVYGGDVTTWKKFANSFILSLTMQLSKQYPGSGGYSATEFSAALNHSAGVIENVEDEMWYQHANAPGAENPLSRFRPADYNLAQPFTDALKGQAGNTGSITHSNTNYDARLDVFADDPGLDGRPYGLASYPDGSGPYSNISAAVGFTGDGTGSPLHYMTAAYTYLNRAEAALMGWTSENAQTLLEEGIVKSYETIDAHYDDGSASSGTLQDDGTTFAAQRLTDATNVGMAQVIAEEKWVALFPMGFDAWSEWRRTGIPGLIPSPDAFNDGSIPRRYLFPSTESGVNTSNYNAGVEMLSPSTDSNTSQFWWDMN